MILAYLDKNGDVRPPETWDEIRGMYCDNWDSCSPCTYCGGHSRTMGGFVCNHPLNPYNAERGKQ